MSRIGEIVLVEFPFTNGAMIKIRPALVVGKSEDGNDDFKLAYITSQVERYQALPSAILLSQSDFETGTLNKESLVRLDKIALINQHRISKVGLLKPVKIEQILRAITLRASAHYVAETKLPVAFVPGESVIPPSGKVIDAEEISNMVEASLDGWLTTGRFNAEFEKKLAAFIGVKHLITVNSGSSANLVAFMTLDFS